MSPPRISICIPAFEAHRFLPQSLASLPGQSFSAWELIVVDDGSPDDPESIVRDFAATVSQPVTFFRQPQNQGAAAARNTCIRLARTEWIALLDAHDRWSPDHLQVSFACARWHDAGVVHGASTAFAADRGKLLGVHAPTPAILRNLPRALFRGAYTIPTSSVLLRRAAWERVGGFDPKFRHRAAHEMWLRCARLAVPFAYTGHETSFHRHGGRGPEPRAAAVALAHAEALEKNADWAALPPALRHRWAGAAWRQAGRKALPADAEAARRCLERALRHRCFAPWTLALWLFASARSARRRSQR